LIELGRALHTAGEFGRAEEAAESAAQLAKALGQTGEEAHARVRRAAVRVSRAASRESVAELRLEAERAIPILEAAGPTAGLAEAWRRLAFVSELELQMTAAEKGMTRALALARKAGDDFLERSARQSLIGVLSAGPTPVSEALRRSEQLLAGGSGSILEEALLLGEIARLYAALGRFEKAKAVIERSLAALDELGQRTASSFFDTLAQIEIETGNLHAAEETLLRGLRSAEEIGYRYGQTALMARLSLVLYEQGRYDEALPATEASEELGAGRPGFSQALWRAVRAMVLARRGEFGPAEELARKAVARMGDESPGSAAEMLMYLSEVLRLGGRPHDARAALVEAVHLLERKEHVAASRARAALEELGRQRV
jgi:tetratricopeptide (TPR) repeat protein